MARGDGAYTSVVCDHWECQGTEYAVPQTNDYGSDARVATASESYVYVDVFGILALKLLPLAV
jgi:hypothetical protein